MQFENRFLSMIEAGLSELDLDRKPQNLYEPIRYMISLGGKRLRPALVLMSHEMFGGNPAEVIKPAIGLEVFHNFTLMHDDLMDQAPLRRSKATVHEKWNQHIAVLSGDTMFVLACKLISQVNSQYLERTLQLFFTTAIEVCEGQQSDMDFENSDTVSTEQYLVMISNKTASLLGCAAAIGAVCSGATQKDSKHMFEFGRNLGIAFQIHDDILDVYGDSEKFGKQIGGDILANKKTLLLLYAIKNAQGKSREQLLSLINNSPADTAKKIESVIRIYDELQVRKYSNSIMDDYFTQAMKELESVNVSDAMKLPLSELAEKLMVRER